MTVTSLMALLTEAKFNAFFGKAPDGTACPYIVLTDTSNPNFAADNTVYKETTSLRIKLVESEVHDWNLHATLKSVLDGASLPYSVDFGEDSEESACESYYDIRFIGGITNA